MSTSPMLKVQPIQVNDIEIPRIGCFAIIAACNHEEAIASVIIQTKLHVERVIVVDDGSSDQTSAIARLEGAEVIRLDYTTGKHIHFS